MVQLRLRYDSDGTKRRIPFPYSDVYFSALFPPLRSKAYRIATILSSFCTYSIVPYCPQGSLQSPTVSPSVVALLRESGV